VLVPAATVGKVAPVAEPVTLTKEDENWLVE